MARVQNIDVISAMFKVGPYILTKVQLNDSVCLVFRICQRGNLKGGQKQQSLCSAAGTFFKHFLKYLNSIIEHLKLYNCRIAPIFVQNILHKK